MLRGRRLKKAGQRWRIRRDAETLSDYDCDGDFPTPSFDQNVDEDLLTGCGHGPVAPK